MRSLEQMNRLGVTIDMAVEAHALLRGEKNIEVEGVEETIQETDFAHISTIKILNEQGAKALGRPKGTYITIEVPQIHKECALIEKTAALLAEKLRSFLPPDNGKTILLVGLGNEAAVPDALGPKVVRKSMATRHFFVQMPEDVEKGFRSVTLLAPNVLGNTGLESFETVKGIREEVDPACIIIIDSLAAASLTRVGVSFQLANTGITPGSGIGNQRMALNEESLHVPVIAMGVPTVVHAQTILNEALALLKEAWETDNTRKAAAKHIVPEMACKIIDTILQEDNSVYTVTPKNIDVITADLAKTLAIGINLALHPALNMDNYPLYLNI